MKKRLLIIGLLNCIVFLWASDFEKRIDAVYWLTGYYNEVIQKRDRDVILKYIPKYAAQPLIFHYELDKEFYWYEDPSLQFGLLSIMKSYISDERFINIQEYIFTLLKIKKIEENFYEIIVEKKYLNKNAIESAVFRGGNLSKAYNREINTLYFKFDGDYLYIYLEDKKTLLTTYYAYDETEYKCLKNAIKTNQFNMNDYTMPRHADGTSDYDDKIIMPEPLIPTGNTDIDEVTAGKDKVHANIGESEKIKKVQVKSKNQIMAVKIPAVLRAEPSIEKGTPMLKAAAGSRVQIIKVGKKQIIDNIESNWVKVKFLDGAKKVTGKDISPDTVGWLFGGYLE